MVFAYLLLITGAVLLLPLLSPSYVSRRDPVTLEFESDSSLSLASCSSLLQDEVSLGTSRPALRRPGTICRARTRERDTQTPSVRMGDSDIVVLKAYSRTCRKGHATVVAQSKVSA
jgi:hypothetical protein